MRYEARVTAYDMLDQVTVTARVWDFTESQVGDERDYTWITTTVEGVGESDARQWLRDALVALLEEV